MSSRGDSTDLLTVKNFIDGAFVDSDTFIESIDPSTAQVWAQIPDSGEREVEDAVSAASKAFARSLHTHTHTHTHTHARAQAADATKSQKCSKISEQFSAHTHRWLPNTKKENATQARRHSHTRTDMYTI